MNGRVLSGSRLLPRMASAASRVTFAPTTESSLTASTSDKTESLVTTTAHCLSIKWRTTRTVLRTPFLLHSLTMAGTIVGNAKQMLTSVTYTAKVADLQKDSTDPQSKPNKGLTTDYGIYVSDTDNWCVQSSSFPQ